MYNNNNNKNKKGNKEKIDEEIFNIEINILGEIQNIEKLNVKKVKTEIKRDIKKKYKYKNKILLNRYVESIFKNIDKDNPIDNEYFTVKAILIEELKREKTKGKIRTKKNIKLKTLLENSEKKALKIIEEVEKLNVISNRWKLTPVLKNEILNNLEKLKEKGKKEYLKKLVIKELSYREVVLKVKENQKRTLKYVINL